jgi:DNA-binding XRE family transcriptional regulator
MLKVDSNKLILARANIPMTVRELSKASGVAVSTISKIENGHCEPNLITIGKLAKALNIKVQDLLEN